MDKLSIMLYTVGLLSKEDNMVNFISSDKDTEESDGYWMREAIKFVTMYPAAARADDPFLNFVMVSHCAVQTQGRTLSMWTDIPGEFFPPDHPPLLFPVAALKIALKDAVSLRFVPVGEQVANAHYEFTTAGGQKTTVLAITPEHKHYYTPDAERLKRWTGEHSVWNMERVSVGLNKCAPFLRLTTREDCLPAYSRNRLSLPVYISKRYMTFTNGAFAVQIMHDTLDDRVPKFSIANEAAQLIARIGIKNPLRHIDFTITPAPVGSPYSDWQDMRFVFTDGSFIHHSGSVNPAPDYDKFMDEHAEKDAPGFPMYSPPGKRSVFEAVAELSKVSPKYRWVTFHTGKVVLQDADGNHVFKDCYVPVGLVGATFMVKIFMALETIADRGYCPDFSTWYATKWGTDKYPVFHGRYKNVEFKVLIAPTKLSK